MAFFSCVLVAAAVWGAGVLSYNERLVINSVRVLGVSTVDSRQVETTFETGLNDGGYHLFSRSNIFLYPRAQLAKKLLTDLPRIKSVNISRESLLAQAVTVTVEEREARYVWCNIEKCFFMDGDGYIFAPLEANTVTEIPANDQPLTGFAESAETHNIQYTFKGGLVSKESPIGQTFLRGRLSDIVQLLQRLEAAGYAPNGATVENESDFSVDLKQGFYLKVSFDAEASDVVRNLELIVSTDALRGKLDRLLYVDLRFGNRVYYQMK